MSTSIVHDEGVRDAAHRELTSHFEQAVPWTVCPTEVSDYLDHHQVELAAAWEESLPQGGMNGTAALFTAGPPGAGKSTGLAASGLTLGDYRPIDPDDAKDFLLKKIVERGLVDVDRWPCLAADGQRVRPGELAGWVHAASVEMADLVRLRCLRRQENFIMEGTFSWDKIVAQTMRELADHDYGRLDLVDVEVPFDVAYERAKQRWWVGRHDQDSPIGGRFVAEASIKRYFDTPTRRGFSQSAQQAVDAFSLAADLGMDASLTQVFTDSTGEQTTCWSGALLRDDGTVERTGSPTEV